MCLAFEYHGNTLTDTDEAALRLLHAVNHPAVTTYWQARGHASLDENRASLEGVLPWLSHVHIQSWAQESPDPGNRRAPLASMTDTWTDWLTMAAGASTREACGPQRFAMIEFVKDDDPAQFLVDAAVLRRMGESANKRISE